LYAPELQEKDIRIIFLHWVDPRLFYFWCCI